MSSTGTKSKFHQGNEEARSSDSESDIISNLPVELRLQILSFLPTKSAIAASLVSTKWKNLFLLIPSIDLDFDDHGAADSEKKNLFTEFVDKVLKVFLKDVPRINSLRLRCGPDYEPCYARWLQAAKELDICKLDFRFAPMERSCTLINNISGSQTLSSLSFGGIDCLICFPKDGVNLPKLKEVWLHDPLFRHKMTLQFILDGCPMLERLTLDGCRCQKVKELYISIPSLKYLAVTADIRSCTRAPFQIMLNTPNLESLISSGCIIGCYEENKLDCLRKAYINCRSVPPEVGWEDLKPQKTKFQQKLEELIVACPRLENLVLLKPSMGLYHSNPLLPPLYYLRMLELSGMDIYAWKKLPGILVNAPSLENLSITGEFTRSCFESFSISLPEVLPKSFLLHLKQICFSGFDGEQDDIRLIAYFLQKALVLEKMKIMVENHGSREENSFWDYLSMLPRQSKACLVYGKCIWNTQWPNLEDRFIGFDLPSCTGN